MSTPDDAHNQTPQPPVVALLGNPNVGKTTLFNRLCSGSDSGGGSGAAGKTSNFPGTTQEALIGHTTLGGPRREVVDLPGVYSLDLDTSEARVAREMLAGRTAPEGEPADAPQVLCVVADATNLPRNFLLLGEALRRLLPTVVVINRVDEARRRGLSADADALSERLGVPVVATSARTGEGVESIGGALSTARVPRETPPGSIEGLEEWADGLYASIAQDSEAPAARDTVADRLDRAFTHPLLGVGVFALVMTGLFWVIFSLAVYPMDWIDWFFSGLASAVSGAMGEGILSDLIAHGVIAGVGATAVFLPQIVLLFFLIALLEDTGYLARAAFVIDRVLRPFGLNGHSFVPLLSSHACALPGIMAARGVPDRRDRLATILVAPFMSCTARIPVYVLLTQLLFPDQPLMQAAAFTGCYVLGILAGLFSSLLIRRTILPGASARMAMELPAYALPSVVRAVRQAASRGWLFLRKAGTVILAMSIVLWWLAEYPKADAPPETTALVQQAEGEADETVRATLLDEADRLHAQASVRSSFLARLGSLAEPALAPLGFDRQLSVGVLASFAAREVFVTTMAVQVAGRDDAEDDGVFSALTNARRDDGSPLFDPRTSWALLVYYVLAMQCLPTLAVTAREAGSWKWAGLQLAWMCGVAYLAALAVSVLFTLVA